MGFSRMLNYLKPFTLLTFQKGPFIRVLKGFFKYAVSTVKWRVRSDAVKS